MKKPILSALAVVIVVGLCRGDAVSDMLQLKREQYRRILVPPHEAAFDPVRMLAAIDDPASDLRTMDRLESLLDCRAALYSLSERIRARDTVEKPLLKLLDTGYKAVNTLDETGAQAVVAALRKRFDTDEPCQALSAYSPFSWLKNFTQWGYVRHPEGMTAYEPDPWNLSWQDGFHMNVVQDERVTTVRAAPSAPCYRQTRFNAPMTDVTVERDWTSTRWRLADRTVTFSVLTPVVDVADVSELTLSGFPTAPDSLKWIDRKGQWRVQRMSQKAAFEVQVVASAIQDFTAPPPPPPPQAAGVQPIDPKGVDRPWFMLESDGEWCVLLLPGERPESAGWERGVFRMSFAKKTYVGVLKAPSNLHSHEWPALAEFFAGVAAAYPRTCQETAKDEAVGWRYGFERRENAWKTSPREIAVLPPLADFAGVCVSGLKRVKYPTKWNVMSYVEGDTVSGILPRSPRQMPVLRGVNIGIHHSEFLPYATNGADTVRIVLDTALSVDENLKLLEAHLKNPKLRPMTFLIDPHSLVYGIGWGSGIPGEKEEAKAVAMWDAISKLCAKYDDRVVGYDLYNEPGIVDGSEARWREVAERFSQTIIRNHPNARIYLTGVYGGNSNGLFNMLPLAGKEQQVITFHYYSPCAFTHQKCQTQNQGDPYVWYPGWQPMIDWAKGIHYGGAGADWYDRWTLAALMMPALEHYAQFGVPLHCGEFSVIGRANQKASNGAFLWTRDVVELLEHAGIGWNVWNWGFGMCHPDVAAYMYRKWKENEK